MDGDSISFHDDEELSGDIVMSDDDIDPNYEPAEEGILSLKYLISNRNNQVCYLPWNRPRTRQGFPLPGQRRSSGSGT